jgi:hypothetical protein
MKKGYALIHGAGKTPDDLISARDAFKCNDKNGYLDKQSFLDFVRSLRTDDYDYLDLFFKCLHEGLRNTNSLRQRKDRGNNFYYWLVFPRANGNEELKVIAHPGIVKLADHINKVLNQRKPRIKFSFKMPTKSAVSEYLWMVGFMLAFGVYFILSAIYKGLKWIFGNSKETIKPSTESSNS